MREVGTTPIDWLGQARVMRMAYLLRVSTDSMETIAALWLGAIVATQLDSSRPGPGWPHRIIEPQLASWLVMSACRATGDITHVETPKPWCATEPIHARFCGQRFPARP